MLALIPYWQYLLESESVSIKSAGGFTAPPISPSCLKLLEFDLQYLLESKSGPTLFF